MAALGKLRNHPHWLELPYLLADKAFRKLDSVIQKIGYHRVDRWMRFPEKLSKQMVFDCQMCGQCTLHFTGMTCPMTCPKNLRNGPCGGVRVDKHCEVEPDMKCVWVEAYEMSVKMDLYGDGIHGIQPPLNRRLSGQSAFVNILRSDGSDMPVVWMSTLETGVDK